MAGVGNPQQPSAGVGRNNLTVTAERDNAVFGFAKQGNALRHAKRLRKTCEGCNVKTHVTIRDHLGRIVDILPTR